MKINNNISAVVSNKHLLRNEGSLSISMEKLSSGFKINHAGDDPSGMAISNKMRAQIRGLDRASQNASDGMSVLETADGALNEVTSMVQRMRELSVQSANGTNSLSDRMAIQDEVGALVEEIQRISETTEFNTKKLLDGSLDNRVYTEGISRVAISNEVPSGTYKLTIDEMPTKATLETGKTWDELAEFLSTSEGKDDFDFFVNINGTGVTLPLGLTGEDYYTLFRSTAEQGEAAISNYNVYNSDTSSYGANKISFSSIAYGNEASLEIQMDAQLKNFFGIEWDEERNAAEPDKSYVKISPGENAIISLNKNASDFGIQSTYSTVTKESGDSASRDVDGRRIRITDVGGFEIDFLIDDRAVKQYNDQEISYTDADGNEVKYTAEEFKRKRASLLEEKAEIEKERNGLEERKANLEKAITDMTTTDEDRAAAQAELKDVEAWLDVIEQAEAGTSVEDQKNSVTGELDSKKTELADLETALEAATDEDEITDLKNQIAAKNAEIEELNTRLAAINKESRLEEIDTEVTNINKALTEASHMPIEMEITDVGPMNLQIGANEGQQMTVRLDSISAENLYLDQIDVTTQRGATRALEQLDEVLSRVTDVRAHIGAYSNRLEHAVASLDQTNENMEQAISRIKDVDMAEEMTEYTKYNVLQQAATSALSQANELPQTALQLLQ